MIKILIILSLALIQVTFLVLHARFVLRELRALRAWREKPPWEQ